MLNIVINDYIYHVCEVSVIANVCLVEINIR